MKKFLFVLSGAIAAVAGLNASPMPESTTPLTQKDAVEQISPLAVSTTSQFALNANRDDVTPPLQHVC